MLNGLDNLLARRHVNRLCLAADVPLIESGTTGYEGSVCHFFLVTFKRMWLIGDSASEGSEPLL